MADNIIVGKHVKQEKATDRKVSNHPCKNGAKNLIIGVQSIAQVARLEQKPTDDHAQTQQTHQSSRNQPCQAIPETAKFLNHQKSLHQ
jgi:hypothetical protein